MTIDTHDDLVLAFQRGQKLPVLKASLATQVAGAWSDLWLSAGVPNTYTPSTLAVAGPQILNKLSPGAIPFTNPGGGRSLYVSNMILSCQNAGVEMALVDRLMQKQDTAASTSNQAVGLDASAVALAGRIGEPDYSDLRWWYTPRGTVTSLNLSVFVEHNNGSSDTIFVNLATSSTTGRMVEIVPYAGSHIKKINSITHNALPGNGGSIFCTRQIASVVNAGAGTPGKGNWASKGLPRVPTDACLSIITLNSTTTSGQVSGNIRLMEE